MQFNWPIFILLSIICIPGILLTTIPIAKSLQEKLKKKGLEKYPSLSILNMALFVQTWLLVIVGAALGAYFANKVNLHAPFFESLIKHQFQNSWQNLHAQLYPAVFIAVPGSLIFLFAYYFMVCKLLDSETINAMYNLRKEVGLLGRILYGGIAEEVIVRWGIMSLSAWLIFLIRGSFDNDTYWYAILFSGILFALGHIPSAINAGCKLTVTFFMSILLLNL